MPALTKNGGPATGLLVENVSGDERTIVLRVDGDPCSSTRLDSIEEDSNAVRVALERSVSGNQPCPASIVFQRVTHAALAAHRRGLRPVRAEAPGRAGTSRRSDRQLPIGAARTGR
jgi:hypothetical protein